MNEQLARILAGVGGNPAGSDGYDPPPQGSQRPAPDPVRDMLVIAHLRRLRQAGVTGRDKGAALAALLADRSAGRSEQDQQGSAVDG